MTDLQLTCHVELDLLEWNLSAYGSIVKLSPKDRPRCRTAQLELEDAGTEECDSKLSGQL